MTASFKPSTGWNPYEMHARLLPTPEDETSWLLQRREGIGASDAAAVLGLDKYSTAYSVWLDKTGQVPLSAAVNEAMELGHILEPIIRDTAARRLGFEVRTIGGLQSRTHDWFRASLDAVLLVPDDGPIPLEVKNTSQFLAEQWADDQVPDRAELQVQHQLGVSGAPYGYVAGMIGGSRIVTRRVDRDQELIDYLIAEEAALWAHVVDGTLPPVVWRDSVNTILASAGRPDSKTLVVAGEQAHEVRRWLDKYAAATADAKAADEAKKEARNNLAQLAHGHTEVVEETGDITHVLFRLQRGGFAAKRFVDEEPDLAPLFMHKIETVDTAALKNEDPDLYRRFQAVSVRIPKGKSA
ncbi:YqaJ viral recombinase family protein [Gordonia sp. HY285]|uniref:YqaJ viral recombinase family nuclease n=1 Tax=Gordonia liuliyuniae TaxID=2911517 RepID=UPI001F1A4639|nr:YqaJ viral recombinase family protein [Gordonia liuliyuniae]MCF8610004.1 YqaJ viral recombinase family protein [Gordonia liuliyuniae]